MGKLNQKSIEVKTLDSAKADEIRQALNNAVPEEDGSKSIHLDLISTEGNVSTAIELVESIHASNTDCEADCTGDIGLAGVILAAACKFNERNAKATAMFRLYEDPKNVGKIRKDLSPDEKNGLEILGKLSGGRKSRIKPHMLKGLKVTSMEAKSLGLVDNCSDFVDKYEKDRKDAKDKAKKTQNDSNDASNKSDNDTK